ncbi:MULTISPECIES: anti-sigma factor [Frankia]|uniref:Regulator of SigK n=1 Tax=Frankia alni (strain DSM 45986 / CECT 9034 / ACN14a) TaxID=326424 RepID=Q0RJN8_FRAAA|nr:MULTISPECIES: anti-sigma factor [Frankia]CAJ62274.1 putative membrane protein [Frankia alni ACN14a]
MNTADAHTLTAAYALDALDAADRSAAEEHIAACPACAAEADRLSRAAANLAQLTAEAPPPALRDAVLDAISVTRQRPPAVPPAPPPADPPTTRHPTRLSTRRAGHHGDRASRPSPAARAIAAVAAAAVVACGVLGGVALDERHQLSAARAQTEQARRLAAAALVATDAASLHGGGTLRTASVGHIAVVSARGLPTLPAGRTYQLWLISAAGPRSAGFVDGRAGAGIWQLDDVRGARSLALTVEPSGGSPVPTTPPVGTTPLPS